MKRSILKLSLVCIATFCLTNVAYAQNSTIYKSPDLGIQFEVPFYLQPVLSDAMFNPLQDDASYLVAKKPELGVYLYAFSYNNLNVNGKQFLEFALGQTNHNGEFTWEDYPKGNRTTTYFAHGLSDKEPINNSFRGELELKEQQCGVYVFTTSLGSNGYVVYLITDGSTYEEHRKTASKIINSLSKL